MADEEGYQFTEDGARRIVSAVRLVEKRRHNERVPRRGRRPPVGGDGTTCAAQNDRQIIVMGGGSSGALRLSLTVPEITATSVTAATLTVTIDYDATSGEVEDAFEAAGLQAGDVTCTNGPLPNTGVAVNFTGRLANYPIALMVASRHTLVGNTVVFVIRDRQGRTGE